ncbi:hypothetical protein Q4S45_13835 [Massilia sp. R2A-15]|uniref:hypothetical protein n=1 Tax=Massilia sp. R2A-15 TaxID=3064278 RepID=UPI002736538D|nr:hypothetical protein [Massilia sp. R2A-15]WLI87817.1 hypothetical protein Q4S45_13835 [Massilia sp. R2A-15]
MKHDQVQALNYCAHAIDDLRETAAALTQIAPHTARVLHRLIVMLRSCVKFILPNCCNLVETDALRQAHLDLMRLPYPCVAFEAPWFKEEDCPAYLGEFEQAPATKRIALCWDHRQFEPLPGLNTFFDAFEGGGTFVVPIYWGPVQKRWTVALGGAFIPYENELAQLNPVETLPASRIALDAKIAAGHAHAKSMQIAAEPFPILPEVFEATLVAYGSRAKANAQIMLDAHDEMLMLIQACSVINCANVTAADVARPEVLNKKRVEKGKQPFFSYKVLQISDDAGKPGRDGYTGHHVSPRMHLRRGHLRQLERKVVWVRPAMVNADSPRGVVHKDYGLAAPVAPGKQRGTGRNGNRQPSRRAV